VWDYCEAPLLPSTYIINTTAATWQDAEESCKSSGGHLVSFMDQTEQVSTRSAANPWSSAMLAGALA
jgi:hypothetical protein